MDYRFRSLVVVLAFAFPVLVSAGYADLPPPPKYTTTTITINGVKSIGTILPSIGNTMAVGKPMMVNAPINLGNGVSANIPLGMKINLLTAATALARAFTTNPLILAAATFTQIAAPFLKEWLDRSRMKTADKSVFTEQKGNFSESFSWDPAAHCKQWNEEGYRTSSFAGLRNNSASSFDILCTVKFVSTDPNNQPMTWSAGTFFRDYLAAPDLPDPLAPTDVAVRMSQSSLPEQLALESPVPLPVQGIVINPDSSGDPQAMRVALSDPMPIPGTSNYSYSAVDIVPSPTTDNPYRVDVRPVTVTSSSSQRQGNQSLPMSSGSGTSTSSSSGTVTNSPGTTSTPSTTPVSIIPPVVPSVVPPVVLSSDPETPPPADSDLCLLHPEVLACQVLDVPVVEGLEVKSVPITFEADTGWGSGAGKCPDAVNLVSGFGVQYSISSICDFMSGIKPVVLAIAWLSAAFIILGLKGNN